MTRLELGVLGDEGAPGAGAEVSRTPRVGLALEAVLRSLLPLDRLERVVEVGFGSGRLAAWLSGQIRRAGTVEAFDPDPARVRSARRTYRDPMGAELVFHRGDLFELPEPRGTAELVVCKKLLCVLPEPERAVDRLAGLAGDGGRVLAIEPGGPQRVHSPDDPSFGRSSERMHRAFRDGWRERGVDQHVGLRVPDLFLQAGLGRLVVEGVVEVHAVADHRRSDADVSEQLRAEASSPDPESLELLQAGGLSPSELDEHRGRAGERLRSFDADPVSFRRSGYVRLMSPLVVTLATKAS